MTRTLKQSRLLLITAGIFAIALIGGVLAIVGTARSGTPVMAPAVFLVVTVAAVMVLLALRYPDIAVVTLIVVDLTRFSNISLEFVGVGVFKPVLALAIASLGLGLATGRLKLRWSPLYLVTLALIAVLAISTLVAGDSDHSLGNLVEVSKDFVYLVVILIWVGSHRSLKLATGTLVITMASLAGLSVVQEFVFNNSLTFFGLSNVDTTQLGGVTLRHTGPEPDANFWARSLVVVLPIAMSWWALAKRNLAKWSAGGAVIAISLGVYLSQSRGALIAAIATVIIWLVLAGRPYYRWLALAPVVLALLIAVPGVGSRLLTLTDLTSSGQQVADPSLQGRIGSQQVGIDMFFDNPVLGVGFGEFLSIVPEYQRKLGIEAEILDAHNLYLEFAAETGAVGLLAWGLFFGFGLFVALRAWLSSRDFASAEERWFHLMAAGVVAGLIAWLLASVFLHAANLRIVFTVLAVGVGLDLALQDRPGMKDGPSDQQSDRRTRRDDATVPAPSRLPVLHRPAAIGLLVLIVAAASSWVFLAKTPPRWVAERHLLLVTDDDAASRYEAYSYDLITRGLVGSTYAALLEDPQVIQRAIADVRTGSGSTAAISMSASYTRGSQVITVRVIGDDADTVQAVAANVVDHGAQFVADLDQPFALIQVESDVTGVRPRSRISIALLAVISVIAGTVTAGIVQAVTSTRRRSTRAHSDH